MDNLFALYARRKRNPTAPDLVIGGDRINHPGEVAMPTADMLAAKILFNSMISTAGARFMTMDIFNTPLKQPDYVRIKISNIPEKIITEYKLHDLLEPDDCIYIMIVLGMYSLPHTGIIANKLLEQLNKHSYYQSKLTPGLWKHKW